MAETTLSKSISAPRPAEDTWLWLVKLATGPLLFVLIGVHFVVNHLVAETGLLTYRDVLAYYQIAIVPIMEGIFLVLVVTHSLLGLRSVILDLHPSRGVIKFMDGFFIIVGLTAVVYGVWLIQVITGRGG